MPDRIAVEDLSYGVLDMQPIDTEWDAESLINGDWRFWEAKEHEIGDRTFWFVVESGSSIAALFTEDGTRVDMTGGTLEVSDIECENCDGNGWVDPDPENSEVETVDCPECDGTGNTLKLDEDDIAEIERLDAYELYAEGPMMNYRYPTGDSEDNVGGYGNATDAAGAAYRLRDLPLCVVEYNDDIALALSGGGMDLSWEIIEAFVLLGYMPPVHFCDLPGMAGRGPDGRHADDDNYLIAAVTRSLTAMVERAQQQLARHLERWNINNETEGRSK